MRGLPAWIVGECVGTFILVFFGCGSVCAAVTTGAQVGVFQVAIVWGLGIATAIYLTAAVLVIFCTTDPNNEDRPHILTAATIGLTVTMLISLLGPLTMACFNPARDLGPRLFSSLAGWNRVPFSANGLGWLTVYVIAPIVGGLLGGGIYRFFFQRHYQIFKHAVISERE